MRIWCEWSWCAGGDSAHGSVLVRLDQPDGGAILESRVLSATGYEWISLHGDTVLSADEASARLDSEIAFDPDCWVVAIDSVMGDNPLKELV